MNIVEMFQNSFSNVAATQNDFSLIGFDTNILIGIDKLAHVCVVIKSSNPHRSPLKHKTQNMSIECNVRVRYSLRDETREESVHIIRCLSENKRDKNLFLELAVVLVQESDGSEDAIMETFNTLRTFFNDKKIVSDSELVGLYAELYTIYYFHESLHIERFWQTRDRMKFDFSFSEKAKLEVKATVKNTRTHHFRHEQLMTEIYNIYVLSYLFRYDDEGLSLYDLLIRCKNILVSDSRKLLHINSILKNVEEERLKNLRFNCDYTEANRHFYSALDIPKFNQNTPNGVANAEYDCTLDNIDFIDDDVFINMVNSLPKE